jgi:hypothetical protein
MALSVHPLQPMLTTVDPSVLGQDGERVLRRRAQSDTLSGGERRPFAQIIEPGASRRD